MDFLGGFMRRPEATRRTPEHHRMPEDDGCDV